MYSQIKIICPLVLGIFLYENDRYAHCKQSAQGSPRGTPGNSWWGVCRLIFQIMTLFQTKKCNFPHLFSDQTSKIHIHLRLALRQKLC